MFGFTKRWERRVRDYCDFQYEKIEVHPGAINYYSRCHIVATHYAKSCGHKRIALVVYREGNNLLPLVHFLNHDGEKFIDNSIGVWCERFEYRFIRWISEDEFFSTPTILTDTGKFFSGMATFWCRLFGVIEN